ncbi:uncharacterized protein LOC131078626 isoform X1 [Cryptomeria japonica]|uniref:uncharacterized protein LOC131078626 isoform X1 n=1 Tax=Cryptomeria japonica TaxID=3369 RepID=UPI0025AC954A|nr:uncharacterized protein LOC131078626 isoform X1 [Cryptomeria japonica]
MEALQSIYGSDCTVSQDEHYCQVNVLPSEENDDINLGLHLIAHFPELYPSSSPPITELDAPWLQESTREWLNIELGKLFNESKGDVVVFRWIEWLKDLAWLWEQAKHWKKEKKTTIDGMISTNVEERETCASPKPQKDFTSEVAEFHLIKNLQHGISKDSCIPSDEKALEDSERILGIVHGVSFTEKRSTFQAHLSPVTGTDQVEMVIGTLLQNRKIAAATHNIMAYRIAIPEKGTILQDYDDDGETAAGSRLLHLLQIVDATNVVVVVSRWFGGILLGPDRFKHINNAARSLLLSCGYIKSAGSSNSTSQQKHGRGSNQKGKKK